MLYMYILNINWYIIAVGMLVSFGIAAAVAGVESLDCCVEAHTTESPSCPPSRKYVKVYVCLHLVEVNLNVYIIPASRVPFCDHDHLYVCVCIRCEYVRTLLCMWIHCLPGVIWRVHAYTKPSTNTQRRKAPSDAG